MLHQKKGWIGLLCEEDASDRAFAYTYAILIKNSKDYTKEKHTI
jgi:hypothetical protein